MAQSSMNIGKKFELTRTHRANPVNSGNVPWGDLSHVVDESKTYEPWWTEFVVNPGNRPVYNNQCNPTSFFCIASLTKDCSDSQILVGGLCPKHNDDFLGRSFLIMPITDKHASITPVPTRISKCKRKFRTISFTPIGSQISDLQNLDNFGDCGPSMDQMMKVISFLSYPKDSLPNDDNFTALKIYIQELYKVYYPLIMQDIHIYQNILVDVTCSPNYIRSQLQNKWFQTNKKTWKCFMDSTTGVHKYFVPLSELCFLDILMFRGYVMDVVVDGAGYEANVGIDDGKIVNGINYAHLNALENGKFYAEDYFNLNYAPAIRDAIKKDLGNNAVLNLDVMTLSTTAVVGTTLSPLPILVSLNGTPPVSMDIDSIRLDLQ